MKTETDPERELAEAEGEGCSDLELALAWLAMAIVGLWSDLRGWLWRKTTHRTCMDCRGDLNRPWLTLRTSHGLCTDCFVWRVNGLNIKRDKPSEWPYAYPSKGGPR